MTFATVIDKYRREASSKRDMGTKFEELMCRYFKSDPTYANNIEWVRLWSDFPYRKQFSAGQDVGIDLVAKTKDGEYWAIQCKCYDPEHTISKEDVDTFLSTSAKFFHEEEGKQIRFSYRFFVSTTDHWSDNANNVILNQDPPVSVIPLTRLEDSIVDWDKLEEGVHGKSACKEKYDLRNHQKDAYNKAIAHFRDNDRGRCIMACGTGKTFTSLRIAEGLVRSLTEPGKQPLILFLAPSIALVGQTLREWSAQANNSFTSICVCSDATVSKFKDEEDNGEYHIEELSLPATTDVNAILLRYSKSNMPTVIFSTYQSIDCIIEAQKRGLPEIDFVICDEAHRTTGQYFEGKKDEETPFTKVHDNSLVHAKKRMYMTATPRLYGVRGKEKAKERSIVLCSMDDESIYGKEFYRISFGTAVDKDLLSDYKVLVLIEGEEGVPRNVRDLRASGIDRDTGGKIWGCLNALAKNISGDETVRATDPGAMVNAISFIRKISMSKNLTELFNKIAALPNSPLNAQMKHIDGTMSAQERLNLTSWLKMAEKEDKKCNILSNVRCLSEGVDVPALDAVMFMSSKSSMIDIVQSVGRVMRKAPGKKYGYIIIPVIVPQNTDAVSALDEDDIYKPVWDVLRALRSHDERLEAEINTFMFQKPTSPGGGSYRGGHIVIGGAGADGSEMKIQQYSIDDFATNLYACLVDKVGDKEYIENWAKKVASIVPELTEKLDKICHNEDGNRGYKQEFNRYLKGLRTCVNDNVSEEQAINMLVQQIVTKPIFSKLFASDGFEMKNSVSEYIDGMLNKIDAMNGLRSMQDKLDDFYSRVENTLKGIDTTEGKQRVITALYEKFFKVAFAKDQQINGIVYTPQEIVDFIIRSACEVITEEFGLNINDERVRVLDPFTGTGTFIARLMESGFIKKENLERKFRYELFANEITLLAYYIATVNIENTLQRMTGATEYIPYDNLLLTDTFNIEDICRKTTSQTTLSEEEYFARNKGRIRKEHDTQFTIIMGNPPYGANQKSANDNAKKRTYDGGIDRRIELTYLDDKLFQNGKGNVNSVYDNYIRAFRWATDRIGDNDGVIAFVTPSGWLTGSAFEGFRKTIESEFSTIYMFNLRGDQNGGNWRAEGEKIFGEGSKVGIGITLLVKRKGHSGKAKILYYQFDDGLKRTEKFDVIKKSKSFVQMIRNKQLKPIAPKPNGDWIIERNEAFNKLIPIAGDTHKKFEKHDEQTIFTGYSRGCASCRDAWAYNFSKSELRSIKESFVNSFNQQIISGQDKTDMRVKWTTPVNNAFKKRKNMSCDCSLFTIAPYRPFVKKWFDCDFNLNEAPYQMPRIYPQGQSNLTICTASVGDKKDFSCLITNTHTDLHFTGTSQCFPLYWYEDQLSICEKKKLSSLPENALELKKHDGISDYALKIARAKYGNDVTKEDIFYYTYGYLHSPEYRKAFAEDLKLSLPRIDFVSDKNDFKAFVDAGRKLAYLHLNYESVEHYRNVKIKGKASVEDILNNDDILKVTKMRIDEKARKIVYNQDVIIEDIPEKAFQYIVNGRSALEWVAEMYQIKTDKESGIKNDPNEYKGGRYIFSLLLSLITVSVKTMDIVEHLPVLHFGNEP